MTCDFCTSPALYGVQVEGARLGAYVCKEHLTTAVDDALEPDSGNTEVIVWRST